MFRRSLWENGQSSMVSIRPGNASGSDRSPSDGSVQGPPLRRVRRSDQLDQGALTALARAVDQDHPGVPQRLVHRPLGVPRQQAAERRPRDGRHVATMPPTMVNAYSAARSTRVLPHNRCASCRLERAYAAARNRAPSAPQSPLTPGHGDVSGSETPSEPRYVSMSGWGEGLAGGLAGYAG